MCACVCVCVCISSGACKIISDMCRYSSMSRCLQIIKLETVRLSVECCTAGCRPVVRQDYKSEV